MSIPQKVDGAGVNGRYAVFGNPVEHSLSPQIHSMFAKQTGKILTYIKQEVGPVDPDDLRFEAFRAAVSEFRESGGHGLNVTVPFKEDAFRLAQRRTDRAQLAGAVNTLFWTESSLASGVEALWGDNTDGVGLIRDITERLKISLRGAKVLLLGAGGAAKGVLFPLVRAGVSLLCVANRTPGKAVGLVQKLQEQLTLESDVFMPHSFRQDRGAPLLVATSIEEVKGPFDVIIHATSWGVKSGAVEWSLSPSAMRGALLVYDMVYKLGGDTAFLAWARRCGCDCSFDGLGMLVEQAAEAFWQWWGVRPLTAPVYQYFRPPLQSAL